MDINSIKSKYVTPQKQREDRGKKSEKELIREILDRSTVQAEVYRVTMCIGLDTYVGYLHEYTRKIIKDPIYRDIGETLFVPVWYTPTDMEELCMSIAHDYELFENPQVRIMKIIHN